MNTVVLFLLKSTFVSGLLVTWYWLALRRAKLYNYNRAFLLFTLYASIQVPLLHFQWVTIPVKQAAGADAMPLFLQAATGEGVKDVYANSGANPLAVSWDVLVLYALAAISVLLLGRLLLNIVLLLRKVKGYRQTIVSGVQVVYSDEQRAPFSFLNYLFWKNTIPMESEKGRMILEHELVHIRQRHTYDKLASQIFSCIFWMNPFYWLIRKELEMIHEFIADEHAVKESNTAAFATMLLGVHNNGAYLAPEHSFFSSPIKRRLTMLQANKKTSHAWLRCLAVVPMTATAVLIFSFTTGNKTPITPATSKIVLVVDAGHGGNEAGCSFGGLREKDLNLAVATRIKELAPQHNIEVHLTRSGDVYQTLAERVAFSNNVQPGAFISIHVGNDPKVDTKAEGFDMGIAVDKDNVKKEQSIQLGQKIFSKVLLTKNVKQPEQVYHMERGLYVCKKSNSPSILLELGDIKNKAQMARLTNSAQLDELCHAILNGVVAAKGN